MTDLPRLLALLAMMSLACVGGPATAYESRLYDFGSIAKYEVGIEAAFFRALKHEEFLAHQWDPTACIHVSDVVPDEQVGALFLAAARAIATEEESGFRIGPEKCDGSLGLEISLDTSIVGMSVADISESCTPYSCVGLLEPSATQTSVADGQSGTFWIKEKYLNLSFSRLFYFVALQDRLHRLDASKVAIGGGIN